MPIDLVQLGDKCRRLRSEILGMSLDEVCERTGIERERITKIESGEIAATGDEILMLADVYGEPVEYFITNVRSASIEKASDLYRMYGDTFSSEDRQSIQEFLRLCRMEAEIEALLGSRPRVVKFEPAPPEKHMKSSGRTNADKLRNDLSLGDAPIPRPFHLARALGCHVFRRTLRNSSVSGVMLRHDDIGPCILVNYADDVFRQNFSVTHEICHALLDVDCSTTVSFEREADERDNDRRRREWRANAFAARLLFPRVAVDRLDLGTSDDEALHGIRSAAVEYQINPIVVLYALSEADRLTADEVSRLKPKVKLPREAKSDTDLAGEAPKIQERRERHLRAGLSPEYVETCLRAYREDQISLGRLAEALLASPGELDDRLAELGHELGANERTT